MSLMDKQMDNIGSSSNSGKKQQNYLAIPQLLSIFKQLPPCNMQQYCDVRPTTVLTTCKRAQQTQLNQGKSTSFMIATLVQRKYERQCVRTRGFEQGEHSVGGNCCRRLHVFLYHVFLHSLPPSALLISYVYIWRPRFELNLVGQERNVCLQNLCFQLSIINNFLNDNES